ncbi:MAG TPA: AcvB/VirJ family lysyl-phosphatidylglycerol hydrolase [Burkholderiaceae bacterium]
MTDALVPLARRMRRPLAALVATACMAAPTPSLAAQPASSPESAALSHGLFSQLRVHRPAGATRHFVLLLTHGTAPDAREQAMLRTMLAADAMVVTVPFAPFYRRLAAQDGRCTYGPGAFENLARYLQAYEQVPGYLLPMVAGAGSTASYAHTLVSQAPAGTFAAGLGLAPQALALKPPPCAPNAAAAVPRDAWGVHAATATATPWIAVPADARPAAGTAPDSTAEFARAFRQVGGQQAALGAPPAELGNLPIVEVPAARPGSRFAVLLSGDGGWAGIDKSLGAALAARGVSVAGFDSLRYFWGVRTPDELAADLDRVIRYYAAHWGRSEVLLVGYSQGADVLPFALNRLPPATRASVRLTALLGPGQKASFEFHLSNWIGPGGDRPIAPEALKLDAADTLCIYGLDEKDSLCPELSPVHARAIPLKGGHHFGGDYDALAGLILDAPPR